VTPTERFFLKDLPAAIVRELARFKGLHGSIAFSCGGRKFTVLLGDLEQPVIQGFLRSADVKLWFFDDAFERFLAGHSVLGKKSLKVQGDLDVLDRFGRFLQPADNKLSVRFATAQP
jgi:hypothetical protein